jgi:hypothetical protein
MDLSINVNEVLQVLVIFGLLWAIFKLGEVSQMIKETSKNISNLDGCKPKKTV